MVFAVLLVAVLYIAGAGALNNHADAFEMGVAVDLVCILYCSAPRRAAAARSAMLS